MIPKDIHSEAGSLIIEWSDGHRGVYPFVDLRLACMCANCVDEHTRKQLVKPNDITPDIKPAKAQYVGRYALNIEWSTGHDTGIYPFDYLRKICFCEKCRTD